MMVDEWLVHILQVQWLDWSFFELFQVILLSRWWQLNYFLFSPLPGEMIQFDEHIFQMGWNYQPVLVLLTYNPTIFVRASTI